MVYLVNQSINHLFESGDMAHTQALTHTHTIHNNTKEGYLKYLKNKKKLK